MITEEDSLRYSLPEILQSRAAQTPGQVAYIYLVNGEDQEERITYEELHLAATAIAHSLLEIGRPGDRALTLFPPGLEFIKALFGCFYAGIIAVPAYPPRKNRSLDRLRLLVKDSGATLILSTEEIKQSFERSFKDVTELNALQWNITNNQIPASPPPRLPASLPPCPHASPPSEIALLQYTSGSTGDPKGVMITHRNIMSNCEFIRQSFGFSTQTVAVSWLPTFHDMGLVGQVFQPVYTGFPSILMSPVSFFQKPIRWLRAFSNYRGTMGGAPNFAFDLLAESTTEEEREGLDLSSIKTIYCGAEPIRKSTFDKFLDVYQHYGLNPGMLYPCYGMAETTLITTGPPAGRGPKYLTISGNALLQNKVKKAEDHDQDAKVMVGVGYPWLDTKIRIVNPETLVPCEPDEVGEIWISGASVAPGYWNKDQENIAAFKAGIAEEPETDFYRSGDLGFFREGELYISGRYKDLIIINGRNIYPQDIEFLAENAHPVIRQNSSAAFSIELGGEEKLVVVAEVERSAIMNLDVNAVCDRIREEIAVETELAVHAIQLLRTASILKTSSGKIQRKACKKAFLDKTLDVVGESLLEFQFHEGEPDEDIVDLVRMEAWLMTWIHEQLKVPLNRIDVSRPITAYGLTSMKAIVLQQDFLERYGVSFPPYLFFEKNTLRQLCEKALRLVGEN